MPTQKEVNERVREIFRELKKRGKVRFNRDFLGFTGLADGTITSILKEDTKRPVNLPEKYHNQVKQHWNVTDRFWSTGKGPMFNQEEQQEPEDPNALLKEVNKNLKILIKLLKDAK